MCTHFVPTQNESLKYLVKYYGFYYAFNINFTSLLAFVGIHLVIIRELPSVSHRLLCFGEQIVKSRGS